MSKADEIKAQSLAGKPRILVVDDDPNIADTLKDIIEEWNYGVSTAQTVREALSQVEEASFNAMVVDFNLPDGSGLDIAVKVKEISPASRVILMTGQAGLKMTEGPETIFSYLIKPVDPRELKTILEKIFDSQR
jgi:DNA-binding NtrC family response regulator